MKRILTLLLVALSLSMLVSCKRKAKPQAPDASPPFVQYVTSIDTTELLIAFNEAVNPEYTLDTLNYLILSYETLDVHSVEIDPMKKHSILITEPQESTFYDISIMNIEDLSGNRMKDTALVFLGQGVLPDSLAPNVTVVYPYPGDTLYGFEYIVAYATDNTGVRKVSFFVDDSLIEEVKDYPYFCLIDARKFQEGRFYKLCATAVDFSANIGYSDSVDVFMGWHPEFPYVINDTNTISAGKAPYRADMTADGTRFFFVQVRLPSAPLFDDLVMVNVGTNEIERCISFYNNAPYYLDVFGNDWVYFTGYSSFFIYDILGDQIVRTIDIGGNATGIARTNDEKLYIARNPLEDIVVYSIQADSILDSIPVAGNPTALAFDTLHHELYVCLRSQDLISVIDTDADTVIAEIPLLGSPWEVVFSPDFDRAFVSELNTGLIAEIETFTHSLLDEFTVSGMMHPRGMVLTNNGDYLFVTCEGKALVINTFDHRIEWSFSLGISPLSAVYSPLYEKVYIVCTGSRKIFCIEK